MYGAGIGNLKAVLDGQTGKKELFSITGTVTGDFFFVTFSMQSTTGKKNTQKVCVCVCVVVEKYL